MSRSPQPPDSLASAFPAIVEDQKEFIVCWLPDGTRTFVNEAYCRFFGQPARELIGTSFYPLVKEEDREAIRCRIMRLTPVHPVSHDIHRVHLPDGNVGWQEWTDRGFFDDQGRLLELQSAGRDITGLKRMEEKLRQSEARYRTLVENAPEAITVFNTVTGRFQDANPGALLLFKLTREELLKLGPADLSPEYQPGGERSSEMAKQYLQRALQGEAPVFTWVHCDSQRQPIPCEIRLVLMPSAEGGLVRGSSIDISERQALEERLRQSEKMEAIGKLAGGIAHDFNNLLTAINGYAELALERIQGDQQLAKEVGEIRRAGEQAAALTHQLLEFGRRQVTQIKVICLNRVVRDMTDMLRRLIGEDIQLETSLEERLGGVEMDPAQAERIMLNLVLNARDAMPSGGRLTISTRQVDEQAVLEVRDTGKGMDAPTRSRIFEPFFSTKSRGQGTGLGLSTVYGTVQQSGGTIVCDSEPGGGSVFRISLPLAAGPVAEVDRVQEPVRGGEETILLVEDEDLVRDLVSTALGQYGYQVLTALDAKEATRHADGHDGRIDLLITDVILTGDSGKIIADRMVRDHPGLRVLFISGYTDDLIAHHGVLAPDVAFLPKPFSPQALAAKVRDVLDAPPGASAPA